MHKCMCLCEPIRYTQHEINFFHPLAVFCLSDDAAKIMFKNESHQKRTTALDRCPGHNIA